MQTPQPHRAKPAATAIPEQTISRVVVAGLAGDTGKSLVAIGIARALRERGRVVSPFKKGPDFIDAAWLGAATGRPGRNLDTFIMPDAAIVSSVARAGQRGEQIAVIEGNRGLFDGMDAAGSHSTASLAKLIGAPVVLVVDATKVTRTVAALVLGCRTLDPELRLAGVVLNRIGTARQERVIREAIASATASHGGEVPVLGAIPKLKRQHLPSRHLGLVPAAERASHDQMGAEEITAALGDAIATHVDLNAIERIAAEAAPLPAVAPPAPPPSKRARIGVLRDEAFSFYYPENLEALEAEGAELIEISPLRDERLPAIDGLYAGGGFPEVYADRLAANRPLIEALGQRVAEGLPVWAECGGLMYLGQAVRRIGDETEHPMVGALPVVLEQMPRPQGHGYVAATIDADNPFFAVGTELRGHEFHYSRIAERRSDERGVNTVMALERGHGVGEGRDGLCRQRIVASYTHLHALGTPGWAPALVAAAAAGGFAALGSGGAS